MLDRVGIDAKPIKRAARQSILLAQHGQENVLHIQLGVVLLSGSAALLADTIHNFADASTAIPLWLAFSLARRAANRRYTYGYGRAEDLAGVFIVAMIVVIAFEFMAVATALPVAARELGGLSFYAWALTGFLGAAMFSTGASARRNAGSWRGSFPVRRPRTLRSRSTRKAATIANRMMSK